MAIVLLPSVACLSAAGGGGPSSAGSDLDCPTSPGRATFHIANVHERWHGLDQGVVFWWGLCALSLAVPYLRRGRKVCSCFILYGLWCNDDRGDSAEERCLGPGREDKEALGGQSHADHKLGPGRLDSCFGHLLFGLEAQMVFQSCHFFPLQIPWQR